MRRHLGIAAVFSYHVDDISCIGRVQDGEAFGKAQSLRVPS